MKLKDWITTNDCLEKIKKSIHNSIYYVYLNNKKYYIKETNYSEYLIGKELELLSLPIYPKITQFLESEQNMEYLRKKKRLLPTKEKINYYIIYEEITGKTLLESIRELSKQDLDNILQTIIFSLRYAWEKIGFVHCDLHLQNIILHKIKEPITLSHTFTNPLFNFKNTIIVEQYLPVIIDFDRSITKNHIKNGLEHMNVLNDIWKVIGHLSLYFSDKRGELILDYIENFIERYEFNERKEEFINECFSNVPTINTRVEEYSSLLKDECNEEILSFF